eukprot:RCo002967
MRVHPLLDLPQPLVLLAHVVLGGHVQQVDRGLRGEQLHPIQVLYLLGVPRAVAPNLLPFVEVGLNLLQNFPLRALGLVRLGYALDLVHGVDDKLLVLLHQLRVDNLQVPDGVNLTLHVGDVGVVEHPNHVVDPIHGLDVRQEGIAQALPLSGPLHQPGNVHHGEVCRDLAGGLVELAQPQEAFIGDVNPRLRGVDGAERIVLRRNAGLRQHVKEAGLPDIGHPHNSNRQTRGVGPPQHQLGGLLFLLFGRHRMGVPLDLSKTRRTSPPRRGQQAKGMVWGPGKVPTAALAQRSEGQKSAPSRKTERPASPAGD